MFSVIVVGTDGSSTAKKAVALGIELARATGATLHAVTAFQRPRVAAPLGTAESTLSEAAMLGALEESSASVLSEVVEAARPLSIETHARMGPAPDVVMKVATDVGADLIVVGSKGMHRRLLGSIPNSIAHNASCHVLIAKTD